MPCAEDERARIKWTIWKIAKVGDHVAKSSVYHAIVPFATRIFSHRRRIELRNCVRRRRAV
jgi:hypothetical protein